MTDEQRMQWIIDSLEWDGNGYWFPEMVIKQMKFGERNCPPPTLEELREFIDFFIRCKDEQ